MLSSLVLKNQFSLLKNKNVLVALLWMFTLTTLLQYFGNFYFSCLRTNSVAVYIFCGSLLFCPVFGLLTDVWWTRYKLISRSLVVLWLSSIANILFDCVLTSVQAQIRESIVTITLILMSLSLCGTLSSIIQFTTDQLFDGSSADISACASWFVWLFHFSKLFYSLINKCICSHYEPITRLVFPLLLTVAVCADCLTNGVLIKEPVNSNPLKEIYDVVKYCYKNKHPRLRSAFTYCDDKPYSRIDLGKTKYGGPYTAEKVENVKTFFRILVLVAMTNLSLGFDIAFYYHIFGKIDSFFFYTNNTRESGDSSCKNTILKCLLSHVYSQSGFIISLIMLPIYELGLYRLFERWSILFKMSVGFVILLTNMAGYFVIEIVDYTVYTKSNATTCLLVQDSLDGGHHISYYWLIIPRSMLGIGQFVIMASCVEFLCAQVPYSMKGFLFGLVFMMLSLGIGLPQPIFLLVKSTLKYWPSKEQGRCVIWLLLAGNLTFLILFILAWCSFRNYRKRSRDDKEFNEHMFAINYYDRYLNKENN